MKTMRVKSVAGLDLTLSQIWAMKPFIVIGKEAWQIMPMKSQVGEVVEFVDENEQKVELRLVKIEPFFRPSIS